MYRRTLTEDDVAIYAELLSDLAPEQFEAACRAASQNCTFFPTPAEIRAQIKQTDTDGLQLEAEGAWESLLAWVRENYHPDLGISRGAPPLDAATEHAARAAGGFRWIEGCPESDLQWARKSFIEDFTRVHDLGQAGHLLTRGGALKILAEITASQAPHAALPKGQPGRVSETQGERISADQGANQDRPESESAPSSPEGVLRTDKTGGDTHPAMPLQGSTPKATAIGQLTEEELRRRAEEQIHRLRAAGYLQPKVEPHAPTKKRHVELFNQIIAFIHRRWGGCVS